MTDLDSGCWRQDRDEYVAGRLLDQDDIAAWRAETDPERPSTQNMVDWWGAERAAVEAEYDARDWGWWEYDDAE